MKDPRLKIFTTVKPHTFYITFDWDLHYAMPNTQHNRRNVLGRQLVDQFVEELRKQGMNVRVNRLENYSDQYIVFASKYDAMAFKLTWS